MIDHKDIVLIIAVLAILIAVIVSVIFSETGMKKIDDDNAAHPYLKSNQIISILIMVILVAGVIGYLMVAGAETIVMHHVSGGVVPPKA